MERTDPQWALDTLNDRIQKTKSLSATCDNPKEKRRILQERTFYRQRHCQIFRGKVMNFYVDLYPEFRMLCDDIQQLQFNMRERIGEFLEEHLTLPAVCSTVANICAFESVLVRFLMVCQNGGKIGKAVHDGYEAVIARQKERQKKMNLLRTALKSMDLRFRIDAINVFGMDGFQRINDMNACSALPR